MSGGKVVMECGGRDMVVPKLFFFDEFRDTTFFPHTYIRKAAIKPFSFWIFLQRLWGFLMEEFFILSTTTTPTSSPLFF